MDTQNAQKASWMILSSTTWNSVLFATFGVVLILIVVFIWFKCRQKGKCGSRRQRDEILLQEQEHEATLHTVVIADDHARSPLLASLLPIRRFLDLSRSSIESFGSGIVGDVSGLTVSFFDNHGSAFSSFLSRDRFCVRIQGPSTINQTVEAKDNKKIVSFTSTVPGDYHFYISFNESQLPNSPFLFTVLPGSPFLPRCEVHDHNEAGEKCDTVRQISVILRDKYGNRVPILPNQLRFRCVPFAFDISNEEEQECFFPTTSACEHEKINILFTLSMRSVFRGQVEVQCGEDWQVMKSEIIMYALNEQDWLEVLKFNDHKYSNYFDAIMLSEGSIQGSAVRIYITNKQIVIKYSFLPLIWSRVCAWPVSPVTEVTLLSEFEGNRFLPVIAIGVKGFRKIVLACPRRNVLAAVFARILRERTGKSQTFAEKRTHFKHLMEESYQQSRQSSSSSSSSSSSTLVSVRRKGKGFEMIEECYSVLMPMSLDLWKKDWVVNFKGEQGIDAGGLRRELYTILTSAIFAPENGLFTRLSDKKQNVVHPNASTNVALKYFRFAGRIIGKILLQSALYSAQPIPVKFSRSFRAQILGMEITPRFLQFDMPELFDSKIKYIMENDVDELELTFSEEVIVEGQTTKIVDLKPKGRTITVTNANKGEYIWLTCHYRLCGSCQQQIEEFLAGLTEIIPENVLLSFDEDDLDLLIGGASEIDIVDMQQHAQVIRDGNYNAVIVSWFWVAVSRLSPDELCKLLQFITGSMALPPGGFVELSPKLQISIDSSTNGLPTSHTCFNQICIPTYASADILYTKLKIAIIEGSEGFELA